jgi:DNA-binding SARP family transcriptional activator
MIFRILGPLTLAPANSQTFSLRTREARILGALLLQHNQTVPVGSLIDLLYEQNPPATARQQVQNCASKLRHHLLCLTGADVLRIGVSGYRLDVAEEQLDSLAFEQLLARARTAAARGDHRIAASAYRQGLAMWHGEVLANCAVGHFAPLKARLMELRRLATQEWLEAEFHAGRAEAVMSEIAAATSEYPLNERLVDLQMRVLASSGRTTEALQLFRTTRNRLIEEHGVEPGPGLTDLHTAILRGQLDRGPAPGPLTVDGAARTLRTALEHLDRIRKELDRSLRTLDMASTEPEPDHCGRCRPRLAWSATRSAKC